MFWTIGKVMDTNGKQMDELNFCGLSGAKVCTFCRSRRIFQRELTCKNRRRYIRERASQSGSSHSLIRLLTDK